MHYDKIAVIIPCYNEEKSIIAVIDEVRAVLPNAEIYVFDNNSTDKSVALVQAKIAELSHLNVGGGGGVSPHFCHCERAKRAWQNKAKPKFL